MDTVTILRDLWRLRRFVAGVLVLAVLAGVAAKFKLPGFETRRYDVGVASAHILIDTPSSQVVNVSPRGSDTTAARADLLASLMIDGEMKAAIAKRAGLRPNQVIGRTSAATDPSAAGSGAATSGRDAFILSTHVLVNSTGDELPIIAVDTQAPNRAGAAKLAGAAISGLDAYLNSRAAQERVPDADRLQVSGMGVPQATVVARGPSEVIAPLIFIFVFALGCAAILCGRALVHAWRAALVLDRLGRAETALADGPPHEDRVLHARDAR